MAEKRGKLLDAAEVERTWGGVLRTVRAGMLAVPSRIGARLPYLTATAVDEIDQRSATRSARSRATGTCSNGAVRTKAEKTALGIAGVVEIDNRIISVPSRG
jgi:phage terminase Nu1 subunit (DNA packaging protein)